MLMVNYWEVVKGCFTRRKNMMSFSEVDFLVFINSEYLPTYATC